MSELETRLKPSSAGFKLKLEGCYLPPSLPPSPPETLDPAALVSADISYSMLQVLIRHGGWDLQPAAACSVGYNPPSFDGKGKLRLHW